MPLRIAFFHAENLKKKSLMQFKLASFCFMQYTTQVQLFHCPLKLSCPSFYRHCGITIMNVTRLISYRIAAVRELIGTCLKTYAKRLGIKFAVAVPASTSSRGKGNLERALKWSNVWCKTVSKRKLQDHLRASSLATSQLMLSPNKL